MKNRNKKLRSVKMCVFKNWPDRVCETWKYYVTPKIVVIFSPEEKRIEVDIGQMWENGFCGPHRHDWNKEGKQTVSPQDVRNYIQYNLEPGKEGYEFFANAFNCWDT